MKVETTPDGKTYHYPTEASDITPEILTMAEEVYDGWFDGDEPIDWEEFLDRMAGYSLQEDPPWEFDSTDNAAVRKVKRHIREYRRST